MPANTFNAAGLHRDTLCFRDTAGYLNREAEAYRGAFEQFQKEQGNTGVIHAFYVEFDALTHVQNNLPPLPELGNIPRAVGRPVKLIGNVNTTIKLAGQELIDTYQRVPKFKIGMTIKSWAPLFINWLADVTVQKAFISIDAANMHKMRSVLYGLLVKRCNQNDIYSFRVFDIFGGNEKEDLD